MTEKLFYSFENPSQCNATVLSCCEKDGKYHVALDRTVIFPEGGGQLSDTGTINGSVISHAYEENCIVYHETDKPFNVGENVRVILDEAGRLDYTQQHSGEHIISGLASKLFGAKNVGFHMAKDYATLDLDKPLSEDEIDLLEREANKAVFNNVKTEYKIVDAQELENITLRKQAKGLGGEVRIVYVGGVDSCTCCGTHCAYSGGIGTIKITDFMKYKGGVRITFACGLRAVCDAQKNAKSVRNIAKRFSVKTDMAFEAVKKQGDELAELKHMYKERTSILMEYRANELIEGAAVVNGIRLVTTIEKGCTMQDIKLLSEKLCKNNDVAAIIISTSGENIYYQLARGDLVKYSMKEACAAVNGILCGKGGGRDDMASGSAKMREDIIECEEQLQNYFVKVLSNV